MVYLAKAFIVATTVIVPALAAPMQFGQHDVELMSRDVRGVVKSVTSNPTVQKVGNTVKTGAQYVAPVAASLPGKVGTVGAVTSAVVNRRDLEDTVYARAVQSLEARDSIYTLAARELIDAIQIEARRELENRQLW